MPDSSDLVPPKSLSHVGGLLESDDARRKLWGVFVEAVGGPEILEYLVLHYEEGWSYRKLGELAGLSESTLRNRLNRAVDLMTRHELVPARWIDPPVADGDMALKKSTKDCDDPVAGASLGDITDSPPATFVERASLQSPPPSLRAKKMAHPGPLYRGAERRRLLSLVSGDSMFNSSPRFDTDITLLLDRSGSMAAVRESTIAAVNQFVDDQRAAGGAARLSLVQFDHEFQPVFTGVPLGSAPRLTPASYKPRGSTALLDAMGFSIKQTGERLREMDRTDRPKQVLFVTMTDGLENASRVMSRQAVNEAIEHQQKVYDWQFVFLGANQDAIATARDLGMAAGAALNYDADDRGVEVAMKKLSRATARYCQMAPGAGQSFFED